MTTQTLERQKLHHAVDTLPDAAAEKLAHYIDFLRYEEWLEEQEDLEDIAYIKAHKDEPAVPLSDVLKDYEAKHGPLD